MPIKIIKHGRYITEYICKCDYCGCEFECCETDLTLHRGDLNDWKTIGCPECSHELDSDKGEISIK